MTRENDLVRQILLQVEASRTDGPMHRREFDVDADAETLNEHLRMLAGAGFLELRVIEEAAMPTTIEVLRLTWDGHEFLDTIRSDTVWEKTLQKVADTTGSTSLKVLQSLATAIAKSELGL